MIMRLRLHIRMRDERHACVQETRAFTVNKGSELEEAKENYCLGSFE